MKHIDLFSGIGGFSLGFEREGIETIAFVESDGWCREVLWNHWPRVPAYRDVRDLSGLPVSGPIGSWQTDRPYRLSELADVRPDWVVVENTQHRWRAWVPELRSELHGLGYSSVCLQVSAAEVGACHERRRAFVIAHADCEQLRKLSRWWGREGRQVADELGQSWDSGPGTAREDDGLSNWAHRRHAIGNAVSPIVTQLIARALKANSPTVGACGT
jgi:DNA (cytosine-5)-methyltransferase 1